MLGDVVRVVNSLTDADHKLLQLTIGHLLKGFRRVAGDESTQKNVLRRLLGDHGIDGYRAKCRDAIKQTKPLLFMGGKASDYRPKLLQHETSSGMPDA